MAFGAIFKFEGQVAVFNYQHGPTHRCLYPTPPEPGLPVVVHCASGVRRQQAAQLLLAQGFDEGCWLRKGLADY